MPSRGTRRKQTTNTHNAPLTLLSDRACVACPLVRAPPLGGERESSAARREERRERQRTRADREPRQRKADFPWRPRTPRAPRRAPLASCARSFCARLARRRSRGAERTQQERARSRGKPQGRPRTAVPANPDRELRGRAALGLPSHRARRAVRYVRRAPARSAHAPGARRSEGEARAKRRNGTAEAEPTNRRAKYGPRAPRALGARIPYAPCASRRASRAPRARS